MRPLLYNFDRLAENVGIPPSNFLLCPLGQNCIHLDLLALNMKYIVITMCLATEFTYNQSAIKINETNVTVHSLG